VSSPLATSNVKIVLTKQFQAITDKVFCLAIVNGAQALADLNYKAS